MPRDAYEVGVFVVMAAISLYFLPGMKPTCPVNWALIRAGVKEVM